MHANKILTILKELGTSDNYKKIFINGAWGIGKSYYANNYIEENQDNIIYITLFGKTTFESIETDIAKQMINKLSLFKKHKKKLKDFSKKITGSLSYNGISINTPENQKKSVISQYSSLLESKPLIIIIDDLERKSENVPIEDIMGMVEELSQYDKTKIIIIGDENNITSEVKEKWGRFKEKIIEKEYIISEFSEEAIDNIINLKVKEYIDENEIKDFVDNFIKKHKVKNLRTIIKGIKLFREIYDNFLDIKNNKEINLIVLESCMAIVIETTENLYKPSEKDKTKDQVQYDIDKDLITRIRHHYFAPIYINSKEAFLLKYIYNIYNSDYNDSTKSDVNIAINSYLMIEPEEKNLFYLSEENIKDKVKKLFYKMDKNAYNYVTLDFFVDDYNEISKWNDILDIGFSYESLLNVFCSILFVNHYDISNSLYENKIDSFTLKGDDNKTLNKLVDDYNNKGEDKYYNDKFDEIENHFKTKNYNVKVLEWLDYSLLDINKKDLVKTFHERCLNNNFFIPDLSDEIDNDEWHWTHFVWKLYYEKMPDECKNEMNNYIETKKSNKISDYRLNALQRYRPLVKNKNK